MDALSSWSNYGQAIAYSMGHANRKPRGLSQDQLPCQPPTPSPNLPAPTCLFAGVLCRRGLQLRHLDAVHLWSALLMLPAGGEAGADNEGEMAVKAATAPLMCRPRGACCSCLLAKCMASTGAASDTPAGSPPIQGRACLQKVNSVPSSSRRVAASFTSKASRASPLVKPRCGGGRGRCDCGWVVGGPQSRVKCAVCHVALLEAASTTGAHARIPAEITPKPGLQVGAHLRKGQLKVLLLAGRVHKRLDARQQLELHALAHLPVGVHQNK